MIEHFFDCPHCWENQLKMIDPSIEKQNFIEDCEVCCNPLEFDGLQYSVKNFLQPKIVSKTTQQ
jgi:hypothetical protein